MFATSSVELTTVVLFVRTWAGSAFPCSSHVACASAVKPLPMTCTSSVVPRSPNDGFVDVTVGPETALAARIASGGASGASTDGAEHAASSTASPTGAYLRRREVRAKRRGTGIVGWARGDVQGPIVS